jgi:hypothetical protein
MQVVSALNNCKKNDLQMHQVEQFDIKFISCQVDDKKIVSSLVMALWTFLVPSLKLQLLNLRNMGFQCHVHCTLLTSIIVAYAIGPTMNTLRVQLIFPSNPNFCNLIELSTTKSPQKSISFKP